MNLFHIIDCNKIFTIEHEEFGLFDIKLKEIKR